VGLAASACAGPTWGETSAYGRLVRVSVEVEGAPTPLYADPRGTGRLYLEARPGARYEIRLENRTRERLGAAVTVDGLDVISGELDRGRGRMYILDPWGATTIRGWRTSLHDVHRFTFVDEKASYAARSGKANARMGWIEVSVYRERFRPRPCWRPRDWPDRRGYPCPLEEERDSRTRSEEPSEGAPAASVPAPPAAQAQRDEAPQEPSEARSADALGEGAAGGDKLRAPEAREGRRRSFPGTGWGSRTDDPVVVVTFDPEPSPAERLTLRYEYAHALRALGIRPWPETARDRLRERERGEWGFAQPPAR
jgi:hypothetical protein